MSPRPPPDDFHDGPYFDPILGKTIACDCPFCSDGPLDQACAVSWALLALGVQAQKCEGGAVITRTERDAFVAKVWRLLERGGFTAEEARALVVDLP